MVTVNQSSTGMIALIYNQLKNTAQLLNPKDKDPMIIKKALAEIYN